MGVTWLPLIYSPHLLQQILQVLPSRHTRKPNISLLQVCSNLITHLRVSSFSMIKSVLPRVTGGSLYYLFRTHHFIYWVRPQHTLLITLRWLLISLRINFKVWKQHACKTLRDVTGNHNVSGHLTPPKSVSSSERLSWTRQYKTTLCPPVILYSVLMCFLSYPQN